MHILHYIQQVVPLHFIMSAVNFLTLVFTVALIIDIETALYCTTDQNWNRSIWPYLDMSKPVFGHNFIFDGKKVSKPKQNHIFVENWTGNGNSGTTTTMLDCLLYIRNCMKNVTVAVMEKCYISWHFINHLRQL